MSGPNIWNHSLLGTCVQQLSEMACHIFSKKIGCQTAKVSHLGDWGKQFWNVDRCLQGNEAVKSIQSMNCLNSTFASMLKLAPSLDEEAREWFRKLENGDEDPRSRQWFRDEECSGIQPSLQWVAKSGDSYNGEAFYNDKMDAVVNTFFEKGLLVIDKKGLSCQSWEIRWTSALIKKSDGAQLSISHVTWLQPSTVKQIQFAKNPSMLLVKSNLPTSNNSKAVLHKRWAMIGAKTLSVPFS